MKLKRKIAFVVTLLLVVSVFILPAAATVVSASPTTSAIYIDGKDVSFQAYQINGNNYFKLRDIAFAFSGSPKKFQVVFDDQNNQVILTSETDYTVVGGEMEVSGASESQTAEAAPFDVYLNGSKLTLTAYLIGSSNYVKLRDLAAALNFGVIYVPETRAIEIDTSVGYTPVQTKITFPSELGVTFIGDSIGASLAPALKTYFPNIYADAKASRQFYQAKAIIEKLLQENKLGPVVVIELGTNGRVAEADVRKLIDMIGSSRKIVFVNCQVPRSWCEGDNKTFAKVIPEYPNTIIADWYTASLDRSDYFYQDGVHPNKTGIKVLAKVVADTVATIYP